MSVVLTASKTLGGAAVADSLTGGSSGYNLGSSQNGDTNPTQNALYINHDGVQDIKNLSFYYAQYTGTYGGDFSASADFTKLVAHGNANLGMQVDLDYDAATPFTSYTTIKTGVGISFLTRVVIPITAMIKNNGGSPVAPSVPIAGNLGESGNAVLGDFAKLLRRYMMPTGELLSGRRQFDLYFSYNYTS